jgi:hypothetical protein
MLGEPTTPLFSNTDFISLEPYQAQAFATSVTSRRITTSFWSSALRNTLLIVMPADARFFSCLPHSAHVRLSPHGDRIAALRHNRTSLSDGQLRLTDKESSISLSVAANTPVKRTFYLLEGKVESTDYAI